MGTTTRLGIRTLAGVLLVLACAGVAHPAAAGSLAEARQLAAEGDAQAALQMLDELLAERPGDVGGMLFKGVLLTRTGRSDDAIALFRTLAEERPDLAEPHNNLAVLYAAQGRYEDARAALLEAVTREPEYAVAHENLGDIYSRLAALAYARVEAIDPGNRTAAAKREAAERLTSDAMAAPSASPTPPGDGPVARPAPDPAPTPDDAPPVSRAAIEDDSEAPRGAHTALAPSAPRAAPAPCTRIETTDNEQAEIAAVWLRREGLHTDLAKGAGAKTDWRVVRGPLGSRREAQQEVARLRSTGIRDLFIINAGENRNGVSLGVYAREESARRRVEQLAARGIPATAVPRETPGAAPATLTVRGTFPAERFAIIFPDLAVEPGNCP